MRLGSARIPMLLFGTEGLTSARAAVAAALHAGFRAFDCSPVNGNEADVGAALQAFSGKRDDLFVMSKLWNDAKAPDAVRASARASLAALACGYLDLLLIQWPMAWQPGSETADPKAALADTWAAMEALVDEGLVRQLGVANFSLPQVESLLEVARVKPVCNCVELHPLLAQRKLVGTLLRKGVQCIAHSPLGGKDGSASLMEHELLKQALADTERRPEELLVKWNVQRGVPTIVDSANAGGLFQAQGDLDAFFSWKLSEERQKVKLDAMNADQRFVKPSWATFADASEGGARKPSEVFADGQQYVKF